MGIWGLELMRWGAGELQDHEHRGSFVQKRRKAEGRADFFIRVPLGGCEVEEGEWPRQPCVLGVWKCRVRGHWIKLPLSLMSNAGTSTTLWLPNNQMGQVAGWDPQEGLWLRVIQASPLPP